MTLFDPPKYSIRKRLLVWISIPVLIASIFTITIASFFVWHEIEEVYDAQLAQSAKLLFQLTEHEIYQDKDFNLGLEDLNLKTEKEGEKEASYEKNIGFRIWHNDKLVTHSENVFAVSSFDLFSGFSDHYLAGHKWRFFVFIDTERDIKVEVFERYEIRYEIILQLMGALLFPGLIFIPLIFLIVWIGVRKVLKPVVKISADVDDRNSADLSPIIKKELPEEIAPLVLALNRLFLRMEDSFGRERKFTDHAAHELRTPLAAMKTQTQVLLKKAEGVPLYKDGLENLKSAIDRSTHLVNQLLSLARLQNEEFPKKKINLSDCLHDSITDIKILAQEKKITISSKIEEPFFIAGHEDSIMILLRNILDNAIKYSPSDGHVDVLLSKEGALEISDTGQGLSDKDKNKVFDRFVRVNKGSESGSGLGLSIVSWIAVAHDVEITLKDNKPQGLKVIMQWKVASDC